MATESVTGRNVRLAGDWMQDGYIENLNRPQRLSCWLEDGRLFEANDAGTGPRVLYSDTFELTVNDEGDLAPVSAPRHGIFSPASGELNRIGLKG